MKTRSQTRIFPILDLPKELRLSVYDALFEPLIHQPKHWDTYVLPSEWPAVETWRLQTLTTLRRSCRFLATEVQDNFVQNYLPHLNLYFTHVPSLYDLAQRLPPALARTCRFSLRTECIPKSAAYPPEPSCRAAQGIQRRTKTFIHQQSACRHLRRGGLDGTAFQRYRSPELEVAYSSRGCQSITVLFLPTERPFDVRIHLAGGEAEADHSWPGWMSYLEMRGSFADLAWEGYERAESPDGWESDWTGEAKVRGAQDAVAQGARDVTEFIGLARADE